MTDAPYEYYRKGAATTEPGTPLGELDDHMKDPRRVAIQNKLTPDELEWVCEYAKLEKRHGWNVARSVERAVQVGGLPVEHANKTDTYDVLKNGVRTLAKSDEPSVVIRGIADHFDQLLPKTAFG